MLNTRPEDKEITVKTVVSIETGALVQLYLGASEQTLVMSIVNVDELVLKIQPPIESATVERQPAFAEAAADLKTKVLDLGLARRADIAETRGRNRALPVGISLVVSEESRDLSPR